MLCHLEEVEYLQQTGQPGCMVFLDFSKAYDRLSRSWILQCMSSMGFGQNACKWVSIMLQNTSATATFNGWRSAGFPERTGVQQGSPLSPLLYVLGAQPLASHLRQQAQLGIVRPISMSNGQPAPVSHQHADHTSLHVLQPSDAQVAIDSSMALFCAASCSQLNASSHKASWCRLSRSAQPQSVICQASTSSQGSKQSSIWGSAWGTTCKQLVSRPSQASIMPSRLRSVTSQLAACLWGECMWPSRCWQLLCGIMPPFRGHQTSCSIRSAASSGAMWHQHNKAATAMLPRPYLRAIPRTLLSCSARPQGLLCTQARSPALCSLSKGGWGLVHVPTQVQALQAKVVSRLLEPEQLAWKVFQTHHLGLAPQLQRLAYGASILFSTVST